MPCWLRAAEFFAGAIFRDSMTMGKLFWRIFLLFSTTAVVLIVAMTWVAISNFENEKIPGLGISRAEAGMNDQLRRAAQELASGGQEGLSLWLRSLINYGPIQLAVLDENRHELLGRDVPAEIVTTAAQTNDDSAELNGKRLRTRLLEGRNGERYVAIAYFEASPIARILYYRPRTSWMQFGLAFLLSAFAGVVLAYYISAPLDRIRRSTKHFASGDLDARVGRLPFGRSEEIVALASEFDQMAARIKELIEGQRRLVRDISHEMRSPLARARVALELVRQQDDGRSTSHLDRIEHEAERLEYMISQAIELSRMETSTMLRIEDIELDQLLDDIVANAAFEIQVDKRSIRIEQTRAITVQGEREVLHSAIENIVRNALRYTAADSSVAVRLDTHLVEQRQLARIRVQDHGPGVSAADCDRIFEPFYRTDAARQRTSGGSGLGLAIARRGIERQRGQIKARNGEKGGLEVEILLPVV